MCPFTIKHFLTSEKTKKKGLIKLTQCNNGYKFKILNFCMELSEKEKAARRMVCLPLDGISSMSGIRDRVEELSPVIGLFKIGKETYTRFGPTAIDIVKDSGADVFLDLKYYDIPNTIKGAARAASELQVYMFNVHASGGSEMMRAAVEGASSISISNAYVPLIVGVTVLTSIDRKIMNEELRVNGTIEEQVLHLAQLSNESGLDGIVCSAADLYSVKSKLPEKFLYVTPGIKGVNTPAGSDQKRVFTPGSAVQDGSSILVIGRAITEPKTPEERLKAGYEILKDMAKYL